MARSTHETTRGDPSNGGADVVRLLSDDERRPVPRGLLGVPVTYRACRGLAEQQSWSPTRVCWMPRQRGPPS